MRLSSLARRALATLTGAALVFLFSPILYVMLLSFNKERSIIFSSFSTKWWGIAWRNPDVRQALLGSAKAATWASFIALILGTLAALAVHRFKFFGREVLSFLVILPIALPGIVTGIALNSAFRQVLGIKLGFVTMVIAHATFCIVVVYNNVLARLRRLPGNLDEASADLGARPFTTFRTITLPLLRSALGAGALLAMALSFDEIVVTTFTAGASTKTLPQFIFSRFSRPNDLPIVNVVSVSVILISIIPAWLAQWVSSGERNGDAR
jgi:putative spermidine/putrescine transport system permease protein